MVTNPGMSIGRAMNLPRRCRVHLAEGFLPLLRIVVHKKVPSFVKVCRAATAMLFLMMMMMMMVNLICDF
jgi:hypothetical protein